MTDPFEKFSDSARNALSLAQDEARRLNHNYIGTEHILLGLVREGDGVAAQVLRSLGFELNKVRSAVEFMIGRGHSLLITERALTPRVKQVLELAVDEARQLNHDHVDTDHRIDRSSQHASKLLICANPKRAWVVENGREVVAYDAALALSSPTRLLFWPCDDSTAGVLRGLRGAAAGT